MLAPRGPGCECAAPAAEARRPYAAGWPIDSPRASMFAWTPVPEKFRHLGSLEFSKLLIEKADVAVARERWGRYASPAYRDLPARFAP